VRPFFRVLLAIATATSALAFVAAEASAQDGTLGGLDATTTLIGILGGINLPQVNVPDGSDPTNTTQTTTGGTNTTPTTTPTQPTTQPPTTHALGYYCKGESKRHVHGQKRTPFSQCVSAMAKLKNGSSTSATAACRSLSHRHLKGAKSTPYALCVAGGKKLLADKAG
jgi:hypothetical protein